VDMKRKWLREKKEKKKMKRRKEGRMGHTSRGLQTCRNPSLKKKGKKINPLQKGGPEKKETEEKSQKFKKEKQKRHLLGNG